MRENLIKQCIWRIEVVAWVESTLLCWYIWPEFCTQLGLGNYYKILGFSKSFQPIQDQMLCASLALYSSHLEGLTISASTFPPHYLSIHTFSKLTAFSFGFGSWEMYLSLHSEFSTHSLRYFISALLLSRNTVVLLSLLAMSNIAYAIRFLEFAHYFPRPEDPWQDRSPSCWNFTPLFVNFQIEALTRKNLQLALIFLFPKVFLGLPPGWGGFNSFFPGFRLEFGRGCGNPSGDVGPFLRGPTPRGFWAPSTIFAFSTWGPPLRKYPLLGEGNIFSLISKAERGGLKPPPVTFGGGENTPLRWGNTTPFYPAVGKKPRRGGGERHGNILSCLTRLVYVSPRRAS